MNKVEKIKQEIERRIVKAEEFAERAEGANDDSSKLSWDFVATQNKSLIQFIDSLPEENHFEDKSEMVSEDLDIAATSIIKQLGGMEKDDCVSEHELKIFKAAIELQKQKDQETIELAEDHAMLAGMNKMKEEMMGNAIESIVEDWCGDSPDVTIPLNPQYFKTGDKVKIIIVKEEQ